MRVRSLLRLELQIFIATFMLSSAASAVTFEWVTVGDPTNVCDPTPAIGLCRGAVDHEYQIAKFEVTYAQYAEFLNAIATTDTFGLWDVNMADTGFGGIQRSGTPGSYSYSVMAGRGNWPAAWMNFWAATRFANWLHNGQPTGAQDNTTTEDGAYTLTAQGMIDNLVVRQFGAKVFIPNRDEWHKAAYYDTSSTSYRTFPSDSGAEPVCAVPGALPDGSNCGNVVGTPTDVGSYTGNPGPNGTFDQGGNLWEWTESVWHAVAGMRTIRGGEWVYPATEQAANDGEGAPLPSGGDGGVGFRVARLYVPSAVPSLSPFGAALTMVVLGLAGFAARRGRH